MKRKSKNLTQLVSELKKAYQGIHKAVDWEHFRNLWENNADLYEFYELAQKTTGITFEQFNKAWQYRTVLCEDYDQAKDEFINLLLGWY